jgi:2-amino-4-hydroxy-6-hydroxymethyldihydropteridine diphosphokinase
MVEVYIGLGSNLGDGRQNLLQAWKNLACSDVMPVRLSSPYISKPVGFKSSNWFVNAVGRLQTVLAPEKLLELMLGVETTMGRVRSGSSSPEDRTVDLDILFYGNRVIDSENLQVPHPEIMDRLFVLQPLVEIAPLLVHPQSGLTAAEMLERLVRREGGKEDGQEIKPAQW